VATCHTFVYYTKVWSKKKICHFYILRMVFFPFSWSLSPSLHNILLLHMIIDLIPDNEVNVKAFWNFYRLDEKKWRRILYNLTTIITIEKMNSFRWRIDYEKRTDILTNTQRERKKKREKDDMHACIVRLRCVYIITYTLVWTYREKEVLPFFLQYK